MADEKWTLGQVATQTDVVFVKDEKALSREEALLKILNMLEEINSKL